MPREDAVDPGADQDRRPDDRDLQPGVDRARTGGRLLDLEQPVDRRTVGDRTQAARPRRGVPGCPDSPRRPSRWSPAPRATPAAAAAVRTVAPCAWLRTTRRRAGLGGRRTRVVDPVPGTSGTTACTTAVQPVMPLHEVRGAHVSRRQLTSATSPRRSSIATTARRRPCGQALGERSPDPRTRGGHRDDEARDAAPRANRTGPWRRPCATAANVVGGAGLVAVLGGSSSPRMQALDDDASPVAHGRQLAVGPARADRRRCRRDRGSSPSRSAGQPFVFAAFRHR